MSETDTTNTNNNPSNNERKLVINTQYVKDLSVENPNSPHVLLFPQNQPKINVSVDIEANSMGIQDLYEVALKITTSASTQDNNGAENTLFIVDLTYAGAFTLKQVSESERNALLLIYCPNMLFPFARRVIADAVRDAGFPPLMLDPIDFAVLYKQRSAQAAQSTAGTA